MSLAPPHGIDLVGLKLEITYPESVDLPGRADEPTVKERVQILPGGFLYSPNDTDGTTIVWCDTGFEHAVDCAALVAGATVQQGTKSDFGTVDFCGFASACQPGWTATTCSGNTLTLCALGQVYQLDCIAAGYAGCMTSHCMPASLP